MLTVCGINRGCGPAGRRGINASYYTVLACGAMLGNVGCAHALPAVVAIYLAASRAECRLLLRVRSVATRKRRLGGAPIDGDGAEAGAFRKRTTVRFHRDAPVQPVSPGVENTDGKSQIIQLS